MEMSAAGKRGDQQEAGGGKWHQSKKLGVHGI